MKRADELWRNPIAALAPGRRARSRDFAWWVFLPAAVACVVGLAVYSRFWQIVPFLHRLLPNRFVSPGVAESYLLAVALVGFLSLTLAGTVPRAALAVARDREQGRLEPLMLTGLSPAAILWGYLVDVLWTPVFASFALLPLMCLGFLMGGLSLGSIAATFGLLLLCHLLFGTVSLCVSCWWRRTRVVVVVAYLFVSVFLAGTVLLWLALRREDGVNPWWVDGIQALNPAVALLDTAMPQRGAAVGSGEVPLSFFAAVGYPLLSVFAFRLGVRGLRRL